MTEDEVIAYLLEPGAVVAFDTNAIFGDSPDKDHGIDLIDNLNLINQRSGRTIRKVIPSVVYHEKLRQMRQRRGDRFTASLPEAFLADKGIEVEAFDKAHAEHTAERLARLYPKHNDWRSFKKRRCLECVGLSPTMNAANGDGSKCGATVDWLIASQSDVSGYVLVSDDKRDEFAAVARLVTLEVARTAAERLLARL